MSVPDPAEDWVQQLAFEVALGYYPPEDLCLAFDLQPAEFEQLQSERAFQKSVKAYEREVDDEGTAFRLKARRYAEASLSHLKSIIDDSDEDSSVRVKAIELLNRLAGTDKQKEKAEGGTKLIINTNLSIESQRGVYTIEAMGIPANLLEDLS